MVRIINPRPRVCRNPLLCRRRPTVSYRCRRRYVRKKEDRMSEHVKADGAQELPLDMSQLVTNYTNWYQVTGTPEEMILDFGVTATLGVVTADPVRVRQRLVMSFYT